MNIISKSELLALKPCTDALNYVNKFDTVQEAWDKCDNINWLIWYLVEIKFDLKPWLDWCIARIPAANATAYATAYAAYAAYAAANANANAYAAYAYVTATAAYAAAYAAYATAAYAAAYAASFKEERQAQITELKRLVKES